MPDGKGLVFRRRLSGQPAERVRDHGDGGAGTAPRAPLVRGVYARYAPSGHLLVVTSDGKLLAMPFDPKKRALDGPAVAVMDGLLRTGPFEVNFARVRQRGRWSIPSGGSAAANDRLVGEPRRHRRTPVDSTWNPQGNIGTLALSPDGKSLARHACSGARRRTSGSSSFPTGPFSRITFGDTVHFRPAWTADGRSIVYINDLGSGRRPAHDDAGRRHRGARACC